MSTMSRPIAIGLNLPTWPLEDRTHARWQDMRALAREAEAMGVDTLWVADHLLRDQPTGERVGFWECWTIVTALAEATERIGVGPYVACTGFRNPALLAKMATTLDEVSAGRLVLGLGSGVPDRDTSWRAFGYDTEKPVRRFEEAVEVVVRLLRAESLTFEGEVFRTDGAELVPRGPTPGGPPVWVGAVGERTARVAARWADAINVNLALCGPDDMARANAIAADACATVGRDPATLGVTGWARVALDERSDAVAGEGRLAGTHEEIAATVRGFADAGLRHLTLYVGAPDDPSKYPALTRTMLDRFAPLLEAIGGG
jgi:alkanesulfonate monooxygenase SsuD/methylene tetrahydromethanopterin reductase-like flavin-dependent oxidoreductase (luciferase family)